MYASYFIAILRCTGFMWYDAELFRVQAIAKKIQVGKKEALLRKLMAYWTLKRQSGNGVPLVRRLQSNQTAKPHDKVWRDSPCSVPCMDPLFCQMNFWCNHRPNINT